MAIPEQGTCEYTGQLTGDSMTPGECFIDARDRGLGGARRLVGLQPRIRIWGDKVTLINDDGAADVQTVSVYAGDTLLSLARPNDTIFVTRTPCGGFGLSLHRGTELLFALGAVTAVPLGAGVTVTRGGGDWNDPSVVSWLQFDIMGRQGKPEERSCLQLADYWVYVERLWYVGIPGTDECVSILRSMDEKEKMSAVRSATMLCHAGTRIIRKDFRETSC